MIERRRWLAALGGVLLLVACGCSEASAVNAPPSAAARYSQARPAAIAFVHALAAHRAVDGLEAARNPNDQHSLDRLAAWLRRMPLSDVRVDASDIAVSDPDSAGVLLTLHGRLGRAPSTGWLDLGQRALEVRDTSDGWRVTRDFSTGSAIALQQTGLGAVPKAVFRTGPGFVVIDATGRDRAGTATIAAAATEALPRLRSIFSPGAARVRTTIVLAPEWPTAQRIANVEFRHDDVGVELDGTVYIDDAAWRTYDEVTEAGVVVHELTHVVTAPMVRNTPESLIEGVARYEEAEYLLSHGSYWPLNTIASAYEAGYPTAQRWGNRTRPVWGLEGRAAISKAYDDGYAIVRTVVARYGGIGALESLAATFRHTGHGDLTPAQVKGVFRRALAVPFADVEADAHAFALDGGGEG